MILEDSSLWDSTNYFIRPLSPTLSPRHANRHAIIRESFYDERIAGEFCKFGKIRHDVRSSPRDRFPFSLFGRTDSVFSISRFLNYLSTSERIPAKSQFVSRSVFFGLMAGIICATCQRQVELREAEPRFSAVSATRQFRTENLCERSAVLFPPSLRRLLFPVVSMRNGPWFTYMIIVIGSRRAPLSATGKRNERVLLLPESRSSEYISPIDYIRLAPPKIIISVFARVARLTVHISGGSEIYARDFGAR